MPTRPETPSPARLQCGIERFAENSPLGIGVLGPSNGVEYANPAFRRLFGLTAAGASLEDLVCPEPLRGLLQAELAAARESGQERAFTWKKQQWDFRLVPADGTNAEMLVEVRERLPGGSNPSDLLQERGRQLFFKVIDSWPVFVYMQRPDYKVAYANRMTRAYYGEVDGRHCYEVFGGRDSPCIDCPTFQVFETGEPEEWEFMDSHGRTFRIYDYPFEDEDGAPLVMELGIDITELKRVERELYQAHKMRAIGVLAGGMAHDLNNNLVPIIFNVDHALGRLRESPLTEQLANPLEEALRAAYRAADLVEQVLDYSRQQNLSRGPLALAQLIRESLELLQASLPDNVKLHEQYQTRRDCIEANPSQVQQLLLNLCRNAVQAMPAGGSLHVRLQNLRVTSGKDAPHPGLNPGEYVLLTVEDTGHGMNPDALERIFEPFYTTKKETGGTGMGLAVVHAIVTSNGGAVDADSAPGQGTTFRVFLPLATQAICHTAPPRAKPAPKAAGGRLLLVDDDKSALEAMRLVLKDAGFDVTTAPGGREGLKTYMAAQTSYDLVLADHTMPGMTGLDLAGRILKADPDALVVICTGHVEPALEQQARNLGIVGFLMKPMTPAKLVESVRRYCRAAQ